MDLEKLIDKLRNAAGGPEGIKMATDAATAISTLQAENEKLRAELQKSEHDNVNLTGELAKVAAELDDLRTQWDMYGGDVGITAVYKELEQVKRTLAMMWFAYVNSDKEDPHNYETEALEEAERLLGPWKECMPKYLKRGQEE